MSGELETIPTGCAAFLVAVIVALLALALVISLDWQNDTEAWRKEAVRRGAAEWIMNPATGETEWRWKEPPTP